MKLSIESELTRVSILGILICCFNWTAMERLGVGKTGGIAALAFLACAMAKGRAKWAFFALAMVLLQVVAILGLMKKD